MLDVCDKVWIDIERILYPFQGKTGRESVSKGSKSVIMFPSYVLLEEMKDVSYLF